MKSNFSDITQRSRGLNRREFLAAGAIVMAAGIAPARVFGANDRIRLGLIGAGSRGQEDLRDALQQPNTECVAVADIYSRRRDEAKAIVSGAALYDDPRRLLDRKDIDAVIIATPLHLHAQHLLATIAAGKDAYVEKTLTWSIPEAAECLRVVKGSRQVVQVGLQHESEGELADARQWIKDGRLGKVTLVESWMSRNSAHGKGQWVRPIPADCDPQHVNWPLFLGDRPVSAFDAHKYVNWRLFWEFSGGNVTENMVHQIAWIRSALGLAEPVAATMSGGVFSEKDGRQVPDTIAVTLEFANDLIVVWQSTFSNERFGLGEHILGSDGTIEHVAGATDMVIGESDSFVRYYPEKDNRPDGAEIAGKSRGEDHMANWMACMRSRNQATNAPIETGYKSAVAAHMANLAYRQRRRITIEEAIAAKPSF